MKQFLKIINSLLFVFFICFAVFIIISSFSTLGMSKILLVLCIFPLIMVPYILDKIKIYKMDEVLIFLYYVFILLSLVLGGILGFYHKIWWFDLLAHFMSGCLSTLVAFIILEENKLVKKNYKLFGILFIIIFTISVASIWEFFEFTIDKISGNDTQNVKTTGIDDTIEDMLIATLPSIAGGIYYISYLDGRSKRD